MVQQIRSGDEIGPYRVVNELGAGGAAVVYSVQQGEGEEQWALKILRNSSLSDDNVQRRFEREVSIMQKLKHENIVQIKDGGTHENSLYYVMELADSGTLKDVLGHALPWRDAVDVALQLAEALTVLHENDVVHRDLKPGNIYLSSSGHVKLGDFGLARDLNADPLTMEGMTVGTVLYMAPEQLRGQEITPATDLYALGCLLFEMLTAIPPFAGASVTDVCQHHLFTDPPDPRNNVSDCPEALAHLMQKLMAKDASDRPESMRYVATVLKDIRSGDHAQTEESSDSQTPQGQESIGADKSGTDTNPNLVERLRAAPEPRAVSSRAVLTLVVVVALGLIVLGIMSNR